MAEILRVHLKQGVALVAENATGPSLNQNISIEFTLDGGPGGSRRINVLEANALLLMHASPDRTPAR